MMTNKGIRRAINAFNRGKTTAIAIFGRNAVVSNTLLQ
jgi:hypothetical protein